MIIFVVKNNFKWLDIYKKFDGKEEIEHMLPLTQFKQVFI